MPKTRTIEMEMIKSPVEVFLFECDSCHAKGGHKERHVAYSQDGYNGDDEYKWVGVDPKKTDHWGDKYIRHCHACKGWFCQSCATDTSYSVEEGIEMNVYGGFYCKKCFPHAIRGSGSELESRS